MGFASVARGSNIEDWRTEWLDVSCFHYTMVLELGIVRANNDDIRWLL